MATISLCKTCAANVGQYCFIREHKIRKGKSRCNDYENIDFVFATSDEPLPECTDY